MTSIKLNDKIEYKNTEGNYLKGIVIGIRSTDVDDGEGNIGEQDVAYIIQTPHKDKEDNHIVVESAAEEVRKQGK